MRAGYEFRVAFLQETSTSHEHEHEAESRIAHRSPPSFHFVDSKNISCNSVRNASHQNRLYHWARERLANYKVPRHVVALDELPINATGKVVKDELRARAVADVGGR